MAASCALPSDIGEPSSVISFLSTLLLLLFLPSVVQITIFIIIFFCFFNKGKTPGGSKITKKLRNLFGSEPYSGRSSSTKPSCSKTKLKRCTTTEIRWNKNEDARTSPVVSANRLPNSLKNWRASLLIGQWDSTAIGTNSPCDRVQHTWPSC